MKLSVSAIFTPRWTATVISQCSHQHDLTIICQIWRPGFFYVFMEEYERRFTWGWFIFKQVILENEISTPRLIFHVNIRKFEDKKWNCILQNFDGLFHIFIQNSLNHIKNLSLVESSNSCFQVNWLIHAYVVCNELWYWGLAGSSQWRCFAAKIKSSLHFAQF